MPAEETDLIAKETPGMAPGSLGEGDILGNGSERYTSRLLATARIIAASVRA